MTTGLWSGVLLLVLHFKEEGVQMTKILRTVFVDEKEVEGLNKLSAITRIPKAVLIREGIDLVLDTHEKRLISKRKKRERR
jgi:hypothetical protein